MTRDVLSYRPSKTANYIKRSQEEVAAAVQEAADAVPAGKQKAVATLAARAITDAAYRCSSAARYQNSGGIACCVASAAHAKAANIVLRPSLAGMDLVAGPTARATPKFNYAA